MNTKEPISYERLMDKMLSLRGLKAASILADPPWRFANRTGKMAPEHRRLNRYMTLSFDQIERLPVPEIASQRCHLYLWVPNALLQYGLRVMAAWGFDYKTNLVWYKIRKDGGPDRRGVGFYFRNVTELVLFGVRGKFNRTAPPGRRQPNIVMSRKREHSRKPDELYRVIESCSRSPYVELFARYSRDGWISIGDEIDHPRARVYRAYGGAGQLLQREEPSTADRVRRLRVG